MQHPSRTASYSRGLLTAQANRIAGVLIGFWLTPYVLRHLDRAQYGLYTLLIGVVSWLGVCDLGVSAGLQVELSRRRHLLSGVALSRYGSSAVFAQLAIALIVVVLALGPGRFLADFLEVPPELRGGTGNLLGVLGVSVAAAIASRSFSAVLTACRRPHVDHTIQLVVVGVRAGLTVWFLVAGHGLLALAWAHLGGSAAGALLGFLAAGRLAPGFEMRPRHLSGPALRKLASLGVWFSLGGFAGLLIVGTDRVLAAKLVSLEGVAVLYLTGRLYSLAETALAPVVNSARPALGELLGEKRLGAAAQAHGSIERAGLIAACSAVAGIWAGNHAFVTAWVGAEYYGGWALDAALASALLVRLWILPNRALLSAGGMVRPQALTRLFEGALNFVLSLVLGRWLGLFGIAVSTSLAGLMSSCWYLRRLVDQALQGSGRGILAALTPRKYWLVGLLIAVALLGRWVGGEAGGLVASSVTMAATASIAAMVMWTAVADAELRARVRRFVPAIVGA